MARDRRTVGTPGHVAASMRFAISSMTHHPSHHIVISGTGRAGTTFLIQLMTALGMDTGFSNSEDGIFPNCNAGMERLPNQKNAPYIVKSPHLCDSLDTIVSAGTVVVDHLIVPVRDLYSAAESRRRVSRNTNPGDFGGKVPGGLWSTDNPEHQELVLAQKLYALIYAATKHDIPVTLLLFPRLVQDGDYLYGKLAFLFADIARDCFERAFRKIRRLDLVHQFHGG